MSITVTTTYVVAASTHLQFNNEEGFYLYDLYNGASPAITNNGRITITGHDYEPTLVTGNGGGFINNAGAEILVSNTGWRGAYGFAANADFTNAGLLQVTSQSFAIAVDSAYGIAFENSGVIRAIGTDVKAINIFNGAGAFSNTGVIEAIGSGQYVYGVVMINKGAFSNDGTISVSNADPNGSCVGLLYSHFDWETQVIDNRGTIIGGYAIRESSQFAAPDILNNSGLLQGVVDVGNGADQVNNTGSIVGDVYLGLGADAYAGATGHLAGVVLGGLGDDTITTGDDDDIVFGDEAIGSDQDGADTIHTGNGSDILLGGGGADLLDGGGGYDAASYQDAPRGVVVSLAAAGAQATGWGSDTLMSIEALIGSYYGDVLTGDGNQNLLLGLDGDDRLIGGAGDDTLLGGADWDTVDYSSAGSYVTVDLRSNAVQNTDGAGLDTIDGVEHVIGSAFDDRLWGNSVGNKLYGMGGDDQLDGGLGNDTLDGGSGFDTANYGSSTSYVTIDLDYGSIQNTDAAGLDTFASIERVIGGNYDDRFWGSDANNFLHGGVGQDQLNGRGGEDLLDGGANHDILTGGAGPDVFVFRSTSDTHWDFPDRITDFAAGDRIDIGDIDANTTVGGDQAFHIATTPEAAGVYISYDAGSNRTTLRLDTDGDGNPEGRIWLDGDHRGLTAADFVL